MQGVKSFLSFRTSASYSFFLGEKVFFFIVITIYQILATMSTLLVFSPCPKVLNNAYEFTNTLPQSISNDLTKMYITYMYLYLLNHDSFNHKENNAERLIKPK